MEKETPTLDELLRDPNLVSKVSSEEISGYLLMLSSLSTMFAHQMQKVRAGGIKQNRKTPPMNITEAAEYCLCAKYTLREAARKRRMPGATKPGKGWRFTKEGLDKWMQRRRTNGHTERAPYLREVKFGT